MANFVLAGGLLRLFHLVLLLALLAGPSLAATPEAAVAACRSEGAYGQTFGAVEVVGAPLTPRPDEELVVAAPADLAPFQRVAVSQGIVRHEIVVISLTGFLADATQAAAMKAALEQAVAADGRFAWASADNNELRATFDNVDPGQTVASGLRLEIIAIGRWVSISCVDRARFVRAYGEAARIGLD